jgi:hypothetical protein
MCQFEKPYSFFMNFLPAPYGFSGVMGLDKEEYPHEPLWSEEDRNSNRKGF